MQNHITVAHYHHSALSSWITLQTLWSLVFKIFNLIIIAVLPSSISPECSLYAGLLPVRSSNFILTKVLSKLSWGSIHGLCTSLVKPESTESEKCNRVHCSLLEFILSPPQPSFSVCIRRKLANLAVFTYRKTWKQVLFSPGVWGLGV